MIKVSKYIEAIEAYKITPQDVWSENAADNVLKIDWNEAPSDLSFYQDELKKIVNDRGLIAWYPDYLTIKLNDHISEYISLDHNNILTFPGSDVGLETLCRTFLDSDDIAVALCPTYENFFVYALQTGAKLKKINIKKPFFINEKELEKQLTENDKVKLLYLVNPNNPCGYLLSEEFIKRIAVALPNSLIVIDEAYIEFSEQESSAKLIKDFSNIAVFRTFSKGFGMAGLRLGYMCADLDIINAVNKIRNGKNISMIAQKLGICALRNIDLINNWLDEVKEARTIFEDWCSNNHLIFYKSNGNFVMFEVKNPNEVSSLLKSMGIYIRNRNSILPGCIRVTIGSKKHADILIKALESMKNLL